MIAYNGIKALNKAIKSIATMGKKYDTLIHETAIQALLHCQDHGDARPMDQLLNALGKSVRSKGFVLWVQMFSPIRWNGDGQVGVQKATAKGYTSFNIEEANNTPFWAATEENKVNTIDLKALQALIQKKVNDILAADTDGIVYGKDGQPKLKLDGDVVEMKAYANKIKAIA